MRSCQFLACILLILGTFRAEADDPVPAGPAGTQFEKHIRPILATKCVGCHGSEKKESNLRLDSLAAMLDGGESGPAVVVGKPDESLLIEALKYESYEMPPDAKLPLADIERFRKWIAAGAVWPDHQIQIRRQAKTITSPDRLWWAFQPLSKPAVPRSPDDSWSRNAVDRFVYHKLAQQRMEPAPQADTAVLLRRLYFDLIGLPPTPEQIDSFISDDSPNRWEELVDRLLVDPAYGEHWGRFWLDLVRYAESDGWNQDAYRPNMWRYRDYVVNSFNVDRPYPEFVRHQLAGDELPQDDPEVIAATGFLRLGIYEYNQRDAKSHWNDIISEITDVTGDVFFGLGMACARCHDHKFDPILRTDYFRLRAFFEPIIWRDDGYYATKQQLADFQEQQQTWLAASAEVRAKTDLLLKPYRDQQWKRIVGKFPLEIQDCFRRSMEERTSWEHQMAYLVTRQFAEEGGGPLKTMSKEDKQKHEALKKELATFDDVRPHPLPQLMTVSGFAGPISPTRIPNDPTGRSIAPGFPSVLMPAGETTTSPARSVSESPGQRTHLAEWIGRSDNPLTMRVIVNRVWQHHFGRGLVSSANDFGRLGEPPTHPDLLDWLTVSFVENGWSFKQLHKTIVMSATWQQAAHHPQATEYQQLDPGDRLLWRAQIRRLGAEQIRDAMLTVTGELQQKLGGPSVNDDAMRRSIYLKIFRNRPHEFLHAFDAANGLKSVSERDSTTTPLQSLLMMNGRFCLRRAEKLADLLIAEGGDTPDAVLEPAFRRLWGRPPEEQELLTVADFLWSEETAGEGQELERDRLIDLCHILLNSNEFVYVD